MPELSRSSSPVETTALPSGKPRGYLPQLDGLRALAVAAVVVHHYSGENWGFGANAGVKLFFVLSGFLITGILLDGREIIAGGKSWRTVLGHFYARRFLRIFPLYYFVIVLAVSIDLEPARQIIGWLLTYTVNFRMGSQNWYFHHFAHFWSLAVEEQFYLIWPWLVLLLPRRALVPLFGLAVAAGPLYRWYDGVVTGYSLSAYILLPACLDSLAAGALLAVAMRSRPDRSALVDRVINRVVLPTGVVGLVWLWAFPLGANAWQAQVVFGDVALAAIFCWIVARAARGFRGPVGTALGRGPLVYLGKISYGIYVYHPFMPTVTAAGATAMGLDPLPAVVNHSISVVLTLLVASLSWRLLEKPLNDLKRHFP